MKIILALDDIAVADTPDAQDTLAQADFVEKHWPSWDIRLPACLLRPIYPVCGTPYRQRGRILFQSG